MRDGLRIGTARDRSISSALKIERGAIGQFGAGKMLRNNFRLGFGDLRELVFQRGGNTRMQRAPRLAQQQAVGRILNQRVLKQVGRLRRHTVPQQQAGRDHPIERRLKLRVGSARDRRNDGVGKFPADRCADLDHLLAGPEAVEPSHQGRVQACRYRKRGGRNRGGGAPHVALACSFQHRFGHFLHEEGNAIGSLDDVLPDVRGKRLVADHPFDQRVDVALRQPIENLCCYPGPADPGRAELRARGHDQQHRQAPDPLDDAPKQLEACRIGPVRVLEDHQQRLLLCQRFHLGDERLQHALPSARRGKLECRIAAVVCEQQDVGDQARVLARCRGLRQ